MKGVILAGGSGTRLRPITYTGPKQLVPIANRPVLEYAVRDLRAAGITDLAVILGNTGRDAIRDTLGDGLAYGVDITYIVQGDPEGIAHAVACAEDFVGDDSFCVFLGDNLISAGIHPVVDAFQSGDYAAGIATQRVDDPTAFGVVDYDAEENVTALVEKPENPPSNHALVGVYLFTPGVFDHIRRLEPSWRGEYEITHAIQSLLDAGERVCATAVEGWWKDTGTPADVLAANRLVLRADGSRIADSATIADTAVVRGPVAIADGVEVGPGAYLGPYTSLGPDAVVCRAHVENTVVMKRATIDTADRVVDSLIGRRATVGCADGAKPDGRRLIVGRESTVRL